MWLRLRQVCLVAEKLAPVEEAVCEILGVSVCYRDPGVARFGLENALFPIGNQFLEVVAPVEQDTTAGRYLERRGGDGGYILVTQCDDHAARRARVEELGVRIAYEGDRPEYVLMQLHPKDTGGTFLEIDRQRGPNGDDLDGPWNPAGPDWKAGQVLDRVKGIAAVEIQCDEWSTTGKRWSEIMQISPVEEADASILTLDNAELRFVPCADGRPEGMSGIDVVTNDKAAILKSAESRDAVCGDGQIYVCGMRINLV